MIPERMAARSAIPAVPMIHFFNLKVNNREVKPEVEGLLLRSLDSTEQLALSHKNNTVSLSYAAIDYDYPENIRYSYFLDGFDREWNYVGEQRTATYTNLPPGSYVFRVRSTNSDGIWVANERTINLSISPSFWETPLAICLYVLIVALVFGGFVC